MNTAIQTSSPEIKISGLNLRFQHQWLFNNLDLIFHAKKWTTILGPSGVGKTTVLRFIADLINSKDAEISGSIHTSDNLNLSERISYMAQQDLLFPWLTVLENVLIGHKLRCEKNFSAAKKQAHILLNKVDLEKVVNLRPEKLSGGMRQRVALVRALIEDRPIVLMDEPFSTLDVISRLKIQNLAAELLKDRTVILVTHDPLEALRLSDYIYVMQGEPVKLRSANVPAGKTPRDPTSIQLITEQAALLKLLALEG